MDSLSIILNLIIIPKKFLINNNFQFQKLINKLIILKA